MIEHEKKKLHEGFNRIADNVDRENAKTVRFFNKQRLKQFLLHIVLENRRLYGVLLSMEMLQEKKPFISDWFKVLGKVKWLRLLFTKPAMDGLMHITRKPIGLGKMECHCIHGDKRNDTSFQNYQS